MSKTKRSQNERKLRRELEALKAQLKVQINPNSTKHVNQQTSNKVIVRNVEETNKYELPITTIKKDLLKTTLYAFFSVIFILLIKYFMPDLLIKGLLL